MDDANTDDAIIESSDQAEVKGETTTTTTTAEPTKEEEQQEEVPKTEDGNNEEEVTTGPVKEETENTKSEIQDTKNGEKSTSDNNDNNNNSSEAMTGTNRKIFVGGIPHFIDTNKFRTYWEKYGELEKAFLCLRKHNKNEHRGFGFVLFKDINVAKSVFKQKHRLPGMKKDCTINQASVETKKFFLGNMGKGTTVTKEDIREHFSKQGTICKDGIYINKDRGYGFVTMEDSNGDIEEKLAAMKHEIAGVKDVLVKLANEKPDKNRRGSGYNGPGGPQGWGYGGGNPWNRGGPPYGYGGGYHGGYSGGYGGPGFGGPPPSWGYNQHQYNRPPPSQYDRWYNNRGNNQYNQKSNYNQNYQPYQ